MAAKKTLPPWLRKDPAAMADEDMPMPVMPPAKKGGKAPANKSAKQPAPKGKAPGKGK